MVTSFDLTRPAALPQAGPRRRVSGLDQVIGRQARYWLAADSQDLLVLSLRLARREQLPLP